MANEKRLIDATNAEISIRALRNMYKHPAQKAAIGGCVSLIRDLPTVDAVEVVHGRWETTLVPDGYVQKASRMRKKCSVCGWTNACRYNYCPNCGAKMDGDGNDNA